MLRGKKGTRFEGGLRVPLIAAWAAPNADNRFQQEYSIPCSTIDNRIVTCTDMFPTIAVIAGAEIPENTVLDGFDVSTYLRGIDVSESDVEPTERTVEDSETEPPSLARPPVFLAHFPHGRHNNNLFTTYRNGDWKVIYDYDGGTWEFYNLIDDPGEATNLVRRKPAGALELAQQMIAMLDSQNAQYPASIETGAPVKPDISDLEKLKRLADKRSSHVHWVAD